MPMDAPQVWEHVIGVDAPNSELCGLIREDDGVRVKIIFRCPHQKDIVAFDADKKLYDQSGDFTMMKFEKGPGSK
jgi:hypothetical protein